jgi:predicted branched-subunit amino acid permease
VSSTFWFSWSVLGSRAGFITGADAFIGIGLALCIIFIGLAAGFIAAGVAAAVAGGFAGTSAANTGAETAVISKAAAKNIFFIKLKPLWYAFR